MNKPLYNFFENDHRRIETFLEKATEDPVNVQAGLYHQFRTGLLRHIKMEEKILFPAAQKANGGVPLPLQSRLRLEHGALTALMVVPPTPEVITVIWHVMKKHDQVEEEPGGMYDVCEKLASNETEALLEQLNNAPDVPVHPHNEAAYALESAKRSLQRAGYDYNEIVASHPKELLGKKL